MKQKFITLAGTLVLAVALLLIVGCTDSNVVEPTDNATTVLPIDYEKAGAFDDTWDMKVKMVPNGENEYFSDITVSLHLKAASGDMFKNKLGVKYDHYDVTFEGYEYKYAESCTTHNNEDLEIDVWDNYAAPCGSGFPGHAGITWIDMLAGDDHEVDNILCTTRYSGSHGQYIDLFFTSTDTVTTPPAEFFEWICEDASPPCINFVKNCHNGDLRFKLLIDGVDTSYSVNCADEMAEVWNTNSCVHF